MTVSLLMLAGCASHHELTCPFSENPPPQDLSAAQRYVTRDGDHWRVSTEKGEVVLTDQCDDRKTDECAKYELTAYLSHRLLVFRLHFYEGGAYLGIDRENGQQITWYGFPHVSPDGRRFIAVSGTGDYEANYDPEMLAIWSLEHGRHWKNELNYSFPQDTVAYCMSGWRGNNAVDLIGELAIGRAADFTMQLSNFPASVQWNGYYWELRGTP